MKWTEVLDRVWRAGEEAGPGPVPDDLPVPVLWLLGKTGAGKSSLIQVLTGVEAAKVGDGFTPCTRSAMAYDHPSGAPVLRFLDTRGLAEAGYDPAEDLAASERGSHAIVVVARLDDPVQGKVADVLAQVRRRRPGFPVLVLHTGADLVPDPGARMRARAVAQRMFEAAAGGPLPSLELSLAPGAGVPPALVAALAEVLPESALFLAAEKAADEEGRRFQKHRALVFRYAGLAGASDALPVAGLASVPALQGAMLRALAKAYGVGLDRRGLTALAVALGSGAAVRMGAGFGLRQIGKLIPGYGQTLGAAAAAGMSFATTFALGRAAAYWFHHQSRGTPPDREELRRKYAEVLKGAGHG